MTKKRRAVLCVERLKELYPEALCSLEYKEAYELLIAARLSAQCTDARVNIITRELFTEYSSLEELSEAKQEDIEKIIFSCGLYKTKARDIIGISQKLFYEYGGRIPDSMEELLKLPGIGRKTANLIMGDVFKKPAIVTDTHCIRITNRLNLTESKNPPVVERELLKIIPPEESADFCHRMVLFGRDICSARSPKCGKCPLFDLCAF